MTNTTPKNKEITVTIIRIINAPRALVFKAWTDSDQVAQWWGPHGFTNPFCEVDATPGGKLRICMDSPEFPDHWISGVFKEVIEPEKLAFTFTGFEDEKGNAGLEGINRLILEEYNEKTKLTLTATLTKVAPELQAAADGMETGWSQSFERLESLLSGDVSGRQLAIYRLLNAPRELVWEVWTQPEHIAKWWGPEGFTNTIHKMNVEPDGIWEFIMHGPDGTDFKNKSRYIEIAAPQLIIFEHLTGPKFNVTVTFTEQDSKTWLSWKMLFETKEELQKVLQVFKADIGLIQNVDKLENYLLNI